MQTQQSPGRFKRGGAKNAPAKISAESPEKLDRLERGMEAIAIEVERISEGQRFVTNLISESRVPAIPAEKQ